MASITKKYNPKGELIAYQIRVYRGNDGRGQRLKPYLLTWKPDFTMTEKQIQKELNKAADIYRHNFTVLYFPADKTFR